MYNLFRRHFTNKEQKELNRLMGKEIEAKKIDKQLERKNEREK